MESASDIPTTAVLNPVHSTSADAISNHYCTLNITYTTRTRVNSAPFDCDIFQKTKRYDTAEPLSHRLPTTSPRASPAHILGSLPGSRNRERWHVRRIHKYCFGSSLIAWPRGGGAHDACCRHFAVNRESEVACRLPTHGKGKVEARKRSRSRVEASCPYYLLPNGRMQGRPLVPARPLSLSLYKCRLMVPIGPVGFVWNWAGTCAGSPTEIASPK